MRGECHFVAVLLRDFDLSISTISVQSRKYRSNTQRMDTFIYSPYRVRVPNGHCIQISVVDPKAKRDIFLWHEHDLWRPFDLGGCNNVHGKHPFDMLFLEFCCLRKGSVRS